jgi:hypothetical protein
MFAFVVTKANHTVFIIVVAFSQEKAKILLFVCFAIWQIKDFHYSFALQNQKHSITIS